MLNQLTGSLKCRVMKEIYGKILSQQKFFSLNFSSEFISDLANCVKEKRVGPEQILFRQNEVLNELIIILKGTILHQVVLPNGVVKRIKSYKSGDVVGMVSFLQNQSSDFQAKSEDVVQYASVSRADLLNTIKLHNRDF